MSPPAATRWASPRSATAEELMAWPWIPRVLTPRAALVGPGGEQLLVGDDGHLQPWPPAGHRSIAADPTAVRGAR